MPKAKTQQKKVTTNSQASKQLSVKSQKGKSTPVKAASKVIKKKPSQSNGSKAPAIKRPSAPPKKPSTAYIYFNSEMHQQMKSMDKFKTMTLKEKSAIISQSWVRLKAEQKQEYTNCADEDKKRYEKELNLIAKKGFYINKDGADSRDLYKAPTNDAKSKEVEQEEDEKMKEVPQKKQPVKNEKTKEDDDICKPKKPLGKYIIFTSENRIKLLKKNPDLTLTQVAKQCGEDWKKVTEVQMKKYEQLNEKDKMRFEKESKEFKETGFYTNSDGVNSKFMDKKHRVKEFEKGTVMPKRILTAYMCFFIESQNEGKTQVKGDAKYSVTEKTLEISQKWNTMTTVKKQKYEKLHSKDGERYNKQLDEIRSNGFFMTKDGVKSTDLPQKQKRIKKVVAE